MDEVQAARVLARYAPGLSPAERAELLEEQAVLVDVGGVEVLHFDPYSAAVAYLMHPDTVVKRTVGSWSEEFLDPLKLVQWLESQSAALRLSWRPSGAGDSFPDMTLTIRGW